MDAPLDQGLSDSAVDIVDALDLSSLNRPFARKSLTENGGDSALVQICAQVIPKPEERSEFSFRQSRPVCRKILDGFPDVRHQDPPLKDASHFWSFEYCTQTAKRLGRG